MKIIKRLFILIFILILLGLAALYYAFKIEPYRVVTEDYDLTEVTDGSEEVKIALISDLHVKMDFTASEIAKVVEEINAAEPDIVIFAGDLYDEYDSYSDNEGVIEQLSNIQAKYAKIAIRGNRDVGGGAERMYDDIMSQSGFTLLINENETVTLDSGKTIAITGLDDSLLGAPAMPNDAGDGDYSILLTHEPDVVDNYAQYSFDIALSGHSHGGQFHIPLLDSVNERLAGQTELCDEYKSGMYELSGNIGRIFVNTGIGTTHISARFGVPPEVSLMHVYL